MKQLKEIFMKVVFLISACASILAILLICFFLFSNGIPAMSEIGFGNFLLGDEWRPLNGEFGIFPMIIGSLYVTAGAIIVGVPIGLLCAMFMACFCPKRLYSVLKPAIDLMAGIPSIVYGFFGILVIVPAVHNLFGTSGKGLLTASLLLGMMILPTIIGVCETQIRSVPEQYYEGSLALGATHERSVFFVLLPAAKSGVLAGIILGIGRAIGETMAVIIDRGESADYTGEHHQRRTYDDGQYRAGDGVCRGSSQRGADRYRRSSLRIYTDYQSLILGAERKEVIHG